MDNQPKRVLLVATVQSHIGQFHKPLMHMLKENRWEIHVAARNNLAEKDTLTLDYPDKIFDLPFQRSPFDLRNLQAYRQLKAIIKQTHYDVIHCNTPVGGILTRMAARKYRKSGTKVFYTAHGFHFYKGAPRINWMVYYPLEKLFARYTDQLITVNQEDYDFALNHFICPAYHIHGVGADSMRYTPVSQQEKQKLRNEINSYGRIMLVAGELLPNKNQRTVIMALEKVLHSLPDTHLLIAGNGPERENLENLVHQKGLETYVHFLGYTRDLPKYLQASDMLVSCSYREGMPMNVIEAMLCGIPVIASDIRGHRELIHEGMNGLLVNPSDYMQLASKIVEAFTVYDWKQEVITETVTDYTDALVSEELARLYQIIPSGFDYKKTNCNRHRRTVDAFDININP